MYTDPIADLLTRLRNASRAGHRTVKAPLSKFKKAIADILLAHGFVKQVTTAGEGKDANLNITFDTDRPPLELKRISTPGQRRYISAEEIRPVRNGYGIGIISTSRGLMTTAEAKVQGIGGEYICEVI